VSAIDGGQLPYMERKSLEQSLQKQLSSGDKKLFLDELIPEFCTKLFANTLISCKAL